MSNPRNPDITTDHPAIDPSLFEAGDRAVESMVARALGYCGAATIEIDPVSDAAAADNNADTAHVREYQAAKSDD